MSIQDLEIMQLEANLKEYQQARHRLAAKLSELRAASRELVAVLESLSVNVDQIKPLLEGPAEDSP